LIDLDGRTPAEQGYATITPGQPGARRGFGVGTQVMEFQSVGWI
jgi:hypothetical protein